MSVSEMMSSATRTSLLQEAPRRRLGRDTERATWEEEGGSGGEWGRQIKGERGKSREGPTTLMERDYGAKRGRDEAERRHKARLRYVTQGDR